MRLTLTQALALPVLLLGVAATTALRQPGNAAGAYASAGNDIYQAELVGTPAAPHAPAPVVRPLSETGALPVRPSDPLAPAPPAPPAAADGFDVRGAPTVSPALIDRVLAAYGSPMAGEGEQLYRLGLKYGIDPAYCLAFFVNESAAGTRGEAVLTHNLGNIRASAGLPSLDGYRYYDTWLEGAEDWYRLISQVYVKQWGLTSVSAIIPVYAPSGDSNDPATYISNVESLVSTWRAQG